MTSRAALLKVAGECERAAGRSPELNERIAVLVGATDYRRDYTASLDAALTLVPEGFSFKLYCHPPRDDQPGEHHADVYKLASEIDRLNDGQLTRKMLSGPHEGELCAAPALALCAAALRARADTRGL